jgi:hypothetical protein
MWGALLGTALGGLFQSNAASQAADAQTQAAAQQLALQQQMFDAQQAAFAPYLGAGNNALAGLGYEYGLGPRPDGYRGYEQSPGYAAALQGGQAAIDGSAAARGGLFSGATLKAQQQFGQDLASQDYGAYIAGLSGLAGMGQASAANTAAAAGNLAAMGTQSLGYGGDARAAGAIGVGNALSGAINNGIGLWGYQQSMNPNPTTNTPGGSGGWLFGGNSWG